MAAFKESAQSPAFSINKCQSLSPVHSGIAGEGGDSDVPTGATVIAPIARPTPWVFVHSASDRQCVEMLMVPQAQPQTESTQICNRAQANGAVQPPTPPRANGSPPHEVPSGQPVHSAFALVMPRAASASLTPEAPDGRRTNGDAGGNVNAENVNGAVDGGGFANRAFVNESGANSNLVAPEPTVYVPMSPNFVAEIEEDAEDSESEDVRTRTYA